ncbi:hypothetical protein B0T10DRAFT_554265 [Thelonectria olida]|uniref:Uncharacterized protein n=1 Tax=Thelonectria olida TaxID=1576542 RepID=A0A9P8WI10_9HYPO|nr:hypothetical protein B0T10DRAFT_554265 [Thelonectria olida]
MSTKSKSVPQIQIMESSPTATKTRRREPRDTGFPEPFNDVRNTTLPHPDADTSGNACISQEDIDPTRALSRSHRSFLRKKKRHTTNHGRISPQEQAIYSVLSLVNTEHTDSDSLKAISPSQSQSSVRFSKDGTESIISRRDEETPPTSPDVPSHRSKKGLMGRWRRN